MQASYDGLGRRTVKQVQNSADLNATYHYYYHGQSIVEERNGSDLVLRQYLWANLASGYVDELVQVAINADPLDGTEQDCERIYYAMHDANFNVLGIVDDTGTLIERYEYTPYGQRMVYFSAGSADPQAMTPTLISSRVELGGVAQPYALNPLGHQGLMHDEAVGLVYNRVRMLSPGLERFLQRELLSYIDGMSLYQYLRSNPLFYVDWTGNQSQNTDAISIRDPFDPDGGMVEVEDPAEQWRKHFNKIRSLDDIQRRLEEIGDKLERQKWLAGEQMKTLLEMKGTLNKLDAMLSCELDCYKDFFSGKGGLGGALTGIGLPVIPKRFQVAGTSPATSIISSLLGKRWKLARRLWAPTMNNLKAMTPWGSRFIARWTPWVGTALLAWDMKNLNACLCKCRAKGP